MVIKALDVVRDCQSWTSGDTLHKALQTALKEGDAEIVVSFEGVDDVPSAFVNAAFLSLLDSWDFETIRRRLRIVNSTRQINDMIKRRLTFEASARSGGTDLGDVRKRACGL
jgi:STAS-like domain of unknown function (DUF4325)